MANEVVPYFEPGSHITGLATSAVTGKRFVQIDADAPAWTPEGLRATAAPNVPPVEPCAAGARAFGVAQRDAAANALVTVMKTPGMVLPVTSGAAVAAGSEVQSDGTGRAIVLATGKALGLAISAATAADQDLAVMLY